MHAVVHDLLLARRLHRDGRAAARARLRAEVAYVKAVQRRERRLARARVSLPRRALLALGAGLVSIPLDGALQAVTGGVSVYAAVFAVHSFAVLHGPQVPALPQPPAPAEPPALPTPPAPGSVAFPYVLRLERVHDELRRLLPLVAPAGRAAGEEAWQAAAEADQALRWQAARVAAVEPHRPMDPELLQGLEDGVRCQEQLLAAVADLVAASADPLATWRLREATDALHGLAQGLRELR